MLYEMTFDANRKEEREITGFYLQPVFFCCLASTQRSKKRLENHIYFLMICLLVLCDQSSVLTVFSEYFAVMKLIIVTLLVVFGLYCVLAQSESAEETKNSPRKYCNKPACLETASRMLYWMDQTVDICSDLYNFTCQGLSMVR